MTHIRDWWPFGAFILSGVVAFFVGRERQRWRTNQLGQEQERQGARLASVESRLSEVAATLAGIHARQDMLLQEMRETRSEVNRKADR